MRRQFSLILNLATTRLRGLSLRAELKYASNCYK